MSEIISRCQFCLKSFQTNPPSNHTRDKPFSCQICGFECCGECQIMHYQKAHPEQFGIYQEFPHLLESGRVVLFPLKKRK